jgi:anti-sigma-K factor RskA
LKHESISEDYEQAAALYALGALSQHEARAFENHIRDGCPACQAAAGDFEQVVGELGTIVSPQTPPPYLRDILITRLDREKTPPARIIQFPEPEQTRVREKLETRVSPSRSFIPWAVAASLALFAVVAFIAWRQTAQQRNDLQSQVTAIRLEQDQQKAQAEEVEQIKAAISSPDVRVISLEGQEHAPRAHAKVYWNTKSNRWFVAANLSPAPFGKTYQLWFLTPEARVSAGLIKPDQTGFGYIRVEVPSNIGQIDAAAITLEPEGGSPQPTMPIYALGKIAS